MVITTKTTVGTIAYLIGVRRTAWMTVYNTDCPGLIEELDGNEDAVRIRYLCKFRTILMQNFKKIDNGLHYELKNIDRMEFFDPEDIKKLRHAGCEPVLANKRAADYSLHFNRLIAENIDKCEPLFPEWVSWAYIKNLFVIPKYVSPAVQKQEFMTYMGNINFYPFQMYIHWKPQEMGNFLYNDGKFIEELYLMNGDYFGDASKYRDAGEDTKNSIYSFIAESEKTILVVDCENSDAYKLVSMLKSLNPDETEKIHKIMLFDDDHTNNGWDFIGTFTKIPIEHIEVKRVTDRKSLVDVRVTAGICRECYQNNVSSVILLSSDSDYWGLISSLPEADFLVVIEREKSGHAIKEALMQEGIFYCYLDDFCTASIDDMKKVVLLSELRQELPNIIGKNGKELAEALYERARIDAGEDEIMNFYKRYIKTLQLKMDKDGFFYIEAV